MRSTNISGAVRRRASRGAVMTREGLLADALAFAAELLRRNGIRPQLGTCFTSDELDRIGSPLGLKCGNVRPQPENRFGDRDVEWDWIDCKGEARS